MGFDFKTGKARNYNDKIEYAPSKRHLAKWQWYLLILIIISPFLFFLSKVLMDEFIANATGYISYDQITVRAPENGYVNKVLVGEGGAVKKDECIICLKSPLITKELNNLKVEREKLNKLISSTVNPEIEYFNSMKQTLSKHLLTTQKYVETMSGLREKKLSTIMDLQKARTDLKNIELEIEDINRAIARSDLYHRFKLEEQYGGFIRDIDEKIIRLETILNSLKILSPCNGFVAKIFTHQNEYVLKGKALMEITTKNNLRVIAYLNDKFVSGDLRKGMKVKVKLPGNFSLKGEIAQIPSFAEHQEKYANLIKSEKNKVLLIITLLDKLPEKYQIYGLPVKVVL